MKKYKASFIKENEKKIEGEQTSGNTGFECSHFFKQKYTNCYVENVKIFESKIHCIITIVSAIRRLCSVK